MFDQAQKEKQKSLKPVLEVEQKADDEKALRLRKKQLLDELFASGKK